MKVLCIAGHGFEEGEALMPIALLRRAGISVDIAGLDEERVSGCHDISINADYVLDEADPKDYGMLFLPGGPHYKLLEKDKRVIALIKEFMESGRMVAAICAAPTILGHLGYLRNRRYTCFTAMDEDFGGTYIDAYTVTDGQIITGRSVAAAIDFGLSMIEAATGIDTLRAIKERIYY